MSENCLAGHLPCSLIGKTLGARFQGFRVWFPSSTCFIQLVIQLLSIVINNILLYMWFITMLTIISKNLTKWHYNQRQQRPSLFTRIWTPRCYAGCVPGRWPTQRETLGVYFPSELGSHIHRSRRIERLSESCPVRSRTHDLQCQGQMLWVQHHCALIMISNI